jgi:hypothetical protein
MSILSKMRTIISSPFYREPDEPPDFVRQLGTPIDRFNEVSNELKHVAVALALCARGNVERGRVLLRSYGSKVAVAAYTPSGKHAYVYTELLNLAMMAREIAAALPVNEYMWLRAHDRALFSLILNAGKPIQPLFCAGIVAHYREEVRAGHAITDPMVQLAQDAYDQSELAEQAQA